MTWLIRASKAFVIGTIALWIVPSVVCTTVSPGEIGVRQSAVSGVYKEDLTPGWYVRLPGVHKVTFLPSSYFFLDYIVDAGAQEALQVRTKDNNTVVLDVSVPVRIKAGEANLVVQAGNHIKDGDGRYRYQRLAQETTISVLREELANLDSVGFYATQRRIDVSKQALALLNKQLADLHLEAQAVLIRAVMFRAEYEKQLQQIQLNEQNKLLDNAKQKLAAQQQGLDNYVQGTAAQASAKEQDWIKRTAELERAYQVGMIDTAGDATPGATRRALAALAADRVQGLKVDAAKVFGLDDPASVSDPYLIGIKNIQAETLEYKNRVSAEADAISGRLKAEGEAMVAKVQGEFEAKLNALLNSPAGRAYVAWQAAEHVTFGKTLVFDSSEGIPSVLRLRQFAEQFMGAR